MQQINRSLFLKQTTALGALALLGPVQGWLSAATPPAAQSNAAENDIFQRALKANDDQVKKLLERTAAPNFSRRVGFDFATLAAAYAAPGSAYHQQATLATALDKIVDQLLSVQSADGTVSVGNLESPPDTAFLLEPLCSAAFILRDVPATPALQAVLVKLKKFIQNAGEGLVTGGVHTPNHRWVISAALAQMYQLYGQQAYLDRINDWLGEGVFNDKDGHYPERSMTYAYVENKAFLTMGHILERPALFLPVRKNLTMTYFYMEPNGDLVSTDSRRQDQYMERNIVHWYLLYRFFAIHDNNGQYAAIATAIEQMEGFDETVLDNALFYFLETPLLQKALPALKPPPTNFEKLFTTSHLARIRKGDQTATIFGGVDWPLIIASGRSNSPNFFSYRKGSAWLKYMRLSSEFFSMGYFYSDGLKKEGARYLLQKKLQVPYYQPLPKNLRNKTGDYTLSPSVDNRFWNKMAFDKRPQSNIKNLQTLITITPGTDRTKVDFSVTGMDGIAVTVELCLKEGGTLTGVSAPEATTGNQFLEEGEATYQYNGDTLRFGPGKVTHKRIGQLEGERYSTHFGTLRTTGMHVYITGTTPFTHTLNFY